MTYFQNPNPDCERDDCRFSKGYVKMTSAYYPPIYNKNGENINPDKNLMSFNTECLTCGKIWKTIVNDEELTYDE